MDSADQSSSAANFWQNPIFDHFWRHYRKSQSWVKKDWTAVSRATLPDCAAGGYAADVDDLLRHSNVAQPKIFILPPPPPPPPHHFCRKKSKNSRRKCRRRQKLAEFRCLLEMQHKENEEPVDMDVDPVEIHPDFVEFLSQSIKHRAARDQARAQPDSWLYEFDEFTRIDKIGVNRRPVSFLDSLKPPTGNLDQLRKEEMQFLYGSAAEKISAMECLLQVQFDADFDKFNPPLWPNMPFKL